MQLKNLIKNSLLSIFLLSMSALVSAQENVLLETWGQKLDLTIPSLETPSTWVLDSKDKHEIMMGWTCCYRSELINSVQIEHFQKSIEYSSRVNPKRLQFTLVEPISTAQWATFVSLQIADIYTTYRGLKYNCVRELNPIAGERPSVQKMFVIKAVVLTPAIEYDLKREVLTPQTMDEINFLMALVVGNNYNVWRSAEKRCSKR